jgi:hypothetical protein
MFSPPTKENGKTLLGQTSTEKISAWKIALAVVCWASVVIPLVVGVYTLATNGQNPQGWLFLTLRQPGEEIRPEIQKPVAQTGDHRPRPILTPHSESRPETESGPGSISIPEVDPGPPPAEDFDAELEKLITGKSSEGIIDSFLEHSEWFMNPAKQDSLFRFLKTVYLGGNRFFELSNYKRGISSEKINKFYKLVGSSFDADKLFSILTTSVRWSIYDHEMPVCVSVIMSNATHCYGDEYRGTLICIFEFMGVIKDAAPERFKELTGFNLPMKALAYSRNTCQDLECLVEYLSKFDLHFGDVIKEIKKAKSAYAEIKGDPERRQEAAARRQYLSGSHQQLWYLSMFTEDPNFANQEIEEIEKTLNKKEKNQLCTREFYDKFIASFPYDGVKLKI